MVWATPRITGALRRKGQGRKWRGLGEMPKVQPVRPPDPRRQGAPCGGYRIIEHNLLALPPMNKSPVQSPVVVAVLLPQFISSVSQLEDTMPLFCHLGQCGILENPRNKLPINYLKKNSINTVYEFQR